MIGITSLVPLVCLVAASQACGQSIDYIAGTTEITGLSADGRAASARRSSGAMFWSRDSGVYRVWSDFPSGYSAAFAISGNGRVVAGELQSDSNTGAFRWSGPGVWQGVGHTPNTDLAVGTGLNWDGSVMSVTAYVGSNYFVAARWTQETGIQVIGPLAGDFYSFANGVSRDGSTIIGSSIGQFDNAFAWTADGGIRRLERLGGLNGHTYAHGTNHDGSLIVGQTGVAQMCIWRDGHAEILSSELGTVGKAVNDDGTVVVGNILRRDYVAAIWTAGRGFEELAGFLNAHGVILDPTWTLADCTSVSADGKTFGGYAINAARQRIGFVATIPVPSSGIVLLGLLACVSTRRRTRTVI